MPGTLVLVQHWRDVLQRAGFVHITGLPYYDRWLKDENGCPVAGTIQARRCELGRWDQNNGKTVVVNQLGEVWLTAGFFGLALTELSSELGLVGTGAFVPCSNTDEIDMDCLLHRVADPLWPSNSGEYSPVPVLRD